MTNAKLNLQRITPQSLSFVLKAKTADSVEASMNVKVVVFGNEEVSKADSIVLKIINPK